MWECVRVFSRLRFHWCQYKDSFFLSCFWCVCMSFEALWMKRRSVWFENVLLAVQDVKPRRPLHVPFVRTRQKREDSVKVVNARCVRNFGASSFSKNWFLTDFRSLALPVTSIVERVPNSALLSVLHYSPLHFNGHHHDLTAEETLSELSFRR